MKSKSSNVRRAFTLIELLVVVAIIALLIAILLPSLSNARKLAKAAKCGTNLRAITQANAVYAADWGDAIAGSPSTSGAVAINQQTGGVNALFTISNTPTVFQDFDYMTPLANIMNQNFAFPGTGTAGANRMALFEFDRNLKVFTCASNEFQEGPYSGAPSPQPLFGAMLSYTTADMFLANAGAPSSPSVLNFSIPGITLPNAYKPRIGLVGNPSRKIFIADGSKFATTAIKPDIDSTINATLGGACGDWGAHSSFSRSWDRGLAPGNGNPNGGPFEARFYAFRHGGGTPGGTGGSFKMEAAFFDGHVESMDDLTAANPALWAPSGTTMPVSEPWKDAATKYMNNQAYIVP